MITFQSLEGEGALRASLGANFSRLSSLPAAARDSLNLHLEAGVSATSGFAFEVCKSIRELHDASTRQYAGHFFMANGHAIRLALQVITEEGPRLASLFSGPGIEQFAESLFALCASAQTPEAARLTAGRAERERLWYWKYRDEDGEFLWPTNAVLRELEPNRFYRPAEIEALLE